MKLIIVAGLFSIFYFYGDWSLAASKKILLSPFQKHIQDCSDKKFDVHKIDSNKKLYKAIEQSYALLTSETLYREVLYTQKGEQKKLKYENGWIKIFSITDEDDSFKLLSSEKYGEKKEDYMTRHKLRSVEARLSQLLFRAEIKSDYQIIKETRTNQVVMETTWSNSQIKLLNIEFIGKKRALNCIQKELADICNCRM